jgi:hypothetical protein
MSVEVLEETSASIFRTEGTSTLRIDGVYSYAIRTFEATVKGLIFTPFIEQ